MKEIENTTQEMEVETGVQDADGREEDIYITVADVRLESKRKQKKAVKRRLKAEKKAAKALKKRERTARKLQLKRAGKKRRRHFGDRSDGYRIRTLTPFARIAPYIMQIRSDAQNHFEEEIDITDIESYIREKRQAGCPSFGLLHIIIAAYVRGISQRPGINRFIAGNKVYSRNNIEIVMTVKKKMTTTSPDTTMKCVFQPEDTITDIYRKWNAVVEQTIGDNANTDFDKTAKLLNYIPGFLLKLTVRLLRIADYFGLVPRALTRVSPFHGSMVITSMGSLGIGPIYHHLYDFGNLPVFISYGKKYSKIVVDEAGTPMKRHFIGFRAVTDERICDGFYYASAFKIILHGIRHPESLEVPPEKVYEDID